MFVLKLSPESRAQLEFERREALRLYGLTNQWLAAALLRLAREARKTTTWKPDDEVYDARLVWGLIPEMARRLGSVRLEVAEIDWEARAMSDYKLRVCAGHCLANSMGQNTHAWRMLTREPAHGNPVVFAADRLCPGTPEDRQDPLSRSLNEVARCREVSFEGAWAPEPFMRREVA